MAASLGALDEVRLRQALRLAEGSFGLTEPNPRVGCVIGTEDGALLGQGATQRAGGAHAEVMALRDAAATGRSVVGATAWVTLEPCAHHGRTPPCAEALVAAGIGRIVIGALDPFAQVNGAGVARLRSAGVHVVLADGELMRECREVNVGFFSRIERGRPWVRLKLAASLDGRSALIDGRSQWITGEAARRDGHAWRRRAGAVLTGIGTVLADDPRLDVRLVPTPAQPCRVILDSRWRTPVTARILAPPGPVLIVGTQDRGRAPEALARSGAELLELAATPRGVDLGALLSVLASRGVNELHVEAGAALSGALLSEGWIDECLVYLAPKMLGEGLPMAHLPAELGPRALAREPAWAYVEMSLIGHDLRLRLRQNPQALAPVGPPPP